MVSTSSSRSSSFRSSLALALVLATPALAQPPAEIEGLFYRAYFYDRGERDLERALGLYARFLHAAPEHRLAPDAARFSVNLLSQARRPAELDAFRTRWAELLEQSAKAGINARFLDPEMDVGRIKAVFEGESREIFRHRRLLADRVGLKPGQAVADIGAGTGIFSWQFARAVGKDGKVYAVELAPRFLDHLGKLARSSGYDQVEVVRCTERSAGLKPGSIDVAFICDTYHHFEFPRDTMRSIRRALRPGGQVVVIDFERIPGKSREWVLGHVRAGQEVFTKEIESVGFRLLGREEVPLEENYFLRFVKE